jgi:hypothetical protein
MEPEFCGGELEAIMGGIELDLRHASLRLGETYLDVKAVLGGIEIVVPSLWSIEIIPGVVIMGGISDARTPPPAAALASPPLRHLIIRAECILGGIEIR